DCGNCRSQDREPANGAGEVPLCVHCNTSCRSRIPSGYDPCVRLCKDLRSPGSAQRGCQRTARCSPFATQLQPTMTPDALIATASLCGCSPVGMDSTRVPRSL